MTYAQQPQQTQLDQQLVVYEQQTAATIATVQGWDTAVQQIGERLGAIYESIPEEGQAHLSQAWQDIQTIKAQAEEIAAQKAAMLKVAQEYRQAHVEFREKLRMWDRTDPFIEQVLEDMEEVTHEMIWSGIEYTLSEHMDLQYDAAKVLTDIMFSEPELLIGDGDYTEAQIDLVRSTLATLANELFDMPQVGDEDDGAE